MHIKIAEAAGASRAERNRLASPRRPQAAFTLLNLVVTLLILAIVVGLALPRFTELIDRHRGWSTQHDLLQSLQYARHYAIHRNGHVIVCGSHDGKRCGRQAWTDGWIVFEAGASTDDCVIHAAGETCHHGGRVLGVGGGAAQGVRVIANTNIQTRVYFDSLGASRLSNGTFVLCTDNFQSALIVSNSGRIRTTDGVGTGHCREQ